MEGAQSLNAPLARAGRPWWALPMLVVALLVIGLLGYGLWASDRGQLVDGPVPDLTLQTFDGQQVALRQLDQPAIINFWASWCRECDKEMRLLQESHERYGDEVLFLGVDHVDSEEKALAYLAQYGITYPSGPDLGGRFADQFRIQGVPETFFVDREGIIRGIHIGPLGEADLTAWLAELRAP